MPAGPCRLLQVLADTDAAGDPDALELHRALAARGVEVRTVAVAPGRRGDLARQVPTLAPARRSLAALGALRGEARWADVVLLRGTRALPPGTHLLRGLPRLLVLAEPDQVAGGGTGRGDDPRLARLARRSRVEVVERDGPADRAERTTPGLRVATVPAHADAGSVAAQLCGVLGVHR